jgi:hypothetical protein
MMRPFLAVRAVQKGWIYLFLWWPQELVLIVRWLVELFTAWRDVAR